MTTEAPKEITLLLQKCEEGDQLALNQLMPLVYGELRKMAKRHLKNQSGDQTLQTTALIHEAYLKLVNQANQNWTSRTHFYGIATKAMRHILVDYLRQRNREKYGGGIVKVEFAEELIVSKERSAGLIELDEALNRLSEIDERKSRVVELRYFGGLSNDEIAENLKITKRTVIRDWDFARMWLLRELSK